MLKRKYVVAVSSLAIILVLVGSLLYYSMVKAQPPYDLWADINDDGTIDMRDISYVARLFGSSGTPINKTELLLELEARLNSLNASLLTEYYNITDCESLFALLGHMHYGWDIVGGPLWVDEIRLGMVEGDTYIFFFEDGSPTGEYLKWSDLQDRFELSDDLYVDGFAWITQYVKTGYLLADDYVSIGDSEGSSYIYFYDDGVLTGERIEWNDIWDQFYMSNDLEVNGNLDVGGSITMDTETRYYSVPACAFQPQSDTYSHYCDSYLYTTTGGVTYWRAEVSLPHGAVVTSVNACIRDNDPDENICVGLRRVDQGNGATTDLASMCSVGDSLNWRTISDSVISSGTIDNLNYAYYLTLALMSGNSDHLLNTVRITYTITEPLP